MWPVQLHLLGMEWNRGLSGNVLNFIFFQFDMLNGDTVVCIVPQIKTET